MRTCPSCKAEATDVAARFNTWLIDRFEGRDAGRQAP